MKIKKRWSAALLSLCLMLTFLPLSVNAVESSGTCGESLKWTLDNTGTLVISGKGDMRDWAAAPWHEYNDSIQMIQIENGVTSIGARAFSACKSLEHVQIPGSVTVIERYAFWNCVSLKSVQIPDSVTTIGEEAFWNCKSLKDVHIPKSVTSIGRNAFADCSSLKTAGPIGSGNFDYQFGWTEKIPAYAFAGCRNLKEAIIPSSVTSIENRAFLNCNSLKDIHIPNSVTSIGESAFSDCTSLESIEIPENIISLGNLAFSNCIKLRHVTVPGSVVFSEGPAFNGCNGLTSAGPIGSNDSYTFGWTDHIPAYAFTRCNNLEYIHFPDTITSIGKSACAACGSLTSVNIPNGVQSISEYTFELCENLTRIHIPDSVTSIDYGAFDSCENLRHVYYGGTKDQWNQIAIKHANEPLTSANIYYGSNEIGPEISEPVIDAPDILKNAISVGVSNGMLDVVSVTIPKANPDEPAIQKIFCAFSENNNISSSNPASAYKTSSVTTNGQTVTITPDNQNCRAVKIFALDENYRPVCKSTFVTIPTVPIIPIIPTDPTIPASPTSPTVPISDKQQKE